MAIEAAGKYARALVMLAAVLSGSAQAVSADDANNVTPRAGAGRPDYILGPGDQITIAAVEIDEINQKPFRVDDAGYIDLPLGGRIKVEGLTVTQVQQHLAETLRRYVRNPQVTATVTEFRSQPVSVIGAVNSPGVHYLQGSKTLVEALSQAGGLRTDAGHSIKITRRLENGRIPLPNARDDATKQFSIAEVDVPSVLQAATPEKNIPVKANDVISVPRAQTVYVIGEVARSGGFTLGEHNSISVLQALSLAGGLTKLAAAKSSRILRASPGAAKRTEVTVNLKKLMAEGGSDVELHSDDILFVPNSRMKQVTARAAEMAVNVGTGILIWKGL